MLSRVQKGIMLKSKGLIQSNKEFNVLEDNSVKIHLDFVEKYFGYLLSNFSLSPGFPRRYNSLEILELLIYLMQSSSLFSEIFEKLFSRSFLHTLILTLDDPYELNKEISLKLLKALCNNSELVCAKLDVILESTWILASSSRPSDSVTASFVLNAVMFFHPDLKLANFIDMSDFKREKLLMSNCNNSKLPMLWLVYNKLENEVVIAQKNIFQAASNGPMYGFILCLRRLFSILNEKDFIDSEILWSELIDKSIHICVNISEIVANIVRNSSPEGHLPMDLVKLDKKAKDTLLTSFNVANNCVEVNQCELNNGIVLKNDGEKFSKVFEDCELKHQSTNSQILLLCGWRCIKEISLLFGTFIQGCKNGPALLDLISDKNIEDVGKFFITQLLEVKHRGAFEQAHSGFLMVCLKLWQCKSSKLTDLPKSWLNETLNAVIETDTRLCATRRSAGVPYIVEAVVSTEPVSNGGTCLNETMEKLINISNSNFEVETRVHSMNILRSLYRNSGIGENILPFAVQGMKIAINGGESESWSLRNASSLLFSSLVTRMIGVKKSKNDSDSKNSISALVFFKRYPELFDFLLNNLTAKVKSVKDIEASISVFPALLILARLSPSCSDGYLTKINLYQFVPLILEFTSSPIYHLRVLSSKALVSLVNPFNLHSIFITICQKMSFNDQNLLHGSLLCISELLKVFLSDIFKCEKLLNNIKGILLSLTWVSSENNTCSFTRFCSVDIYTFALINGIFKRPQDFKSLKYSCLSLLTRYPKNNSYIPAEEKLLKSVTHFFCSLNLKFNNIEAFLRLLDFPSFIIRSSVIDFILSVIGCTTSVSNFSCTANLFHIHSNFSKKSILKHSTLVKRIITISNFDYKDLDFSKNFYVLLSNIIEALSKEEYLKYEANFEEIFWKIFADMYSQRQHDSIAFAIQCSATILRFKYRNNFKMEVSVLNKWLSELTKFSDVTYSHNIRTEVACQVAHFLSILHLNALFKKYIELSLLKMAFNFLLDDEYFLRKTVSQSVATFLANEKEHFRVSELVQQSSSSRDMTNYKSSHGKKSEPNLKKSGESSGMENALSSLLEKEKSREIKNKDNEVENDILNTKTESCLEDVENGISNTKTESCSEGVENDILNKKTEESRLEDIEAERDLFVKSSPTVILNALIKFMASKNCSEYTTTLFISCLEEEFSVSEVEDGQERLYEKSELKQYREDVVLAKNVTEILRETIKPSNKSSLESNFGFDIFDNVSNFSDLSNKKFVLNHSICDYLLLPVPRRLLNESQEYLSIDTFKAILKRELEYILDQFRDLRNSTPFIMNSYGLWFKRLSKRALLWDLLKNDQDSIEKQYLDHLRDSVIRPSAFDEVLMWLT